MQVYVKNIVRIITRIERLMVETMVEIRSNKNSRANKSMKRDLSLLVSSSYSATVLNLVAANDAAIAGGYRQMM